MWVKTINGINRFTEWMTGIFLVIMVIIIFVQIVSRILIQSSFPWTEELARYLMIWLTFLGASFSFQYGAHIGVEILTSKVPKKVAAFFQVIAALFCIFLFVLLVVKGYELVGKSTMQTSPALSIPMNYVYMIIPISGILMILNVIDVTIKNLLGIKKEET